MFGDKNIQGEGVGSCNCVGGSGVHHRKLEGSNKLAAENLLQESWGAVAGMGGGQGVCQFAAEIFLGG